MRFHGFHRNAADSAPPPPQPELFETTTEKPFRRSHPPHRAVFPSRECPQEHHPGGINIRIRFQIVQGLDSSPQAQAANRSPVIARHFSLLHPLEMRMHSILEAIVKVRINVSIVGSDHAENPRSITASMFQRPALIPLPFSVARLSTTAPSVLEGRHPNPPEEKSRCWDESCGCH